MSRRSAGRPSSIPILWVSPGAVPFAEAPPGGTSGRAVPSLSLISAAPAAVPAENLTVSEERLVGALRRLLARLPETAQAPISVAAVVSVEAMRRPPQYPWGIAHLSM
jgi:hypothetical protein